MAQPTKPQTSTASSTGSDDRVPGTIKRMVTDKSFGFIRDQKGTEYFFHASAVLSAGGFHDLREGDPVLFTPQQGEKGPRAANVERTNIGEAGT